MTGWAHPGAAAAAASEARVSHRRDDADRRVSARGDVFRRDGEPVEREGDVTRGPEEPCMVGCSVCCAVLQCRPGQARLL